jgi:hypothetical protein
LRCASDISLIVRPFLGNIGGGPVGMKCQCRRSSDANGKTALAFCSGVRLARNAVAADVMDDADRSAPESAAPAPAAMSPTTSHILGDRRFNMFTSASGF